MGDVMAKKIRIYFTAYCPYCDRAKALLEAKGLDYEGIDLTDDPAELDRLKDRTGLRTVPQIFIGDELVGGFRELAGLDEDGRLEERLS